MKCVYVVKNKSPRSLFPVRPFPEVDVMYNSGEIVTLYTVLHLALLLNNVSWPWIPISTCKFDSF